MTYFLSAERAGVTSSVKISNQYVPITNLRELRLYAGCRFSRDFDSGTITISQQTVAEKYGGEVWCSSHQRTPLVVGLRLDDFDPTEPEVDQPFRSLVGHFMWLANQTRPNIPNAVRALVRYSHAPKLLHWKSALHVLMYVRFTSSYGITFQRGTANGVVWRCSWIRISRAELPTGDLFVAVMCAGACVSFFSRTQKSVTLSSTEEKYVAIRRCYGYVVQGSYFVEVHPDFYLSGSRRRAIPFWRII